MFWAIYAMVGCGVGMSLYPIIEESKYDPDPPAEIVAAIVTAIFWPFFTTKLIMDKLIK